MSTTQRVVTPKGLVCFPDVFVPKEYNGKSKYNLTLIFEEGEDLKKIEKLIEETGTEAFGKWSPKTMTSSLKDGDTKDEEKYPLFQGKMFISASSNFQPQLIDMAREPILDESEFYAGCYARASVTAYAWTFNGKKGVSLNLCNVQKMADGKALGSSRKAAVDEFDAIATEDSSGDDFDI